MKPGGLRGSFLLDRRISYGANPQTCPGYPDDLAKLHILLPHWIEHNAAHAKSFREWAERARAFGLEAVAKRCQAIESPA
ncbi:MAG: hypothetical protein H8E90_08245 [Anaerolineales bacterium]|nr:hypothetical protein [Anaerolineales bacterium]